jgi:UDPglucose 6-dehydrogenase
VNHQPRVLIVGYGHVGQQMHRYFTDADWVDADGQVHDKDGDVRDKLWLKYDLGFICVPTPQGDQGRCDTSAVEQAYKQWDKWVRYWCLKSTVEVGTTLRLGANVCMSPEWYGETLGHPFSGVSREQVIILGGPRHVTEAFAEAWSLVTNSYSQILQTTARTAELVKLMENAWIAAKVSFCNQFYDLAKLAEVDWNELRELWLADPRVGRSHTYVYPHNRGWAGKCLPKDTANLCAWARDAGAPATLIEWIRMYNWAIRAPRTEV